MHPGSCLMSDSLHSLSQLSARTCYDPGWSHNSKLLALSGGLPRCPTHSLCCCTVSILPPCFPQAYFPFPKFCLKSPPVLALHLIVFSYPTWSSLVPKLLISFSKTWSYSHYLPLSQAPYLGLLSVFTPLDPRVLPSSHV